MHLEFERNKTNTIKNEKPLIKRRRLSELMDGLKLKSISCKEFYISESRLDVFTELWKHLLTNQWSEQNGKNQNYINRNYFFACGIIDNKL